MIKRKKAVIMTANLPFSRDKGTDNIPIIERIKALFLRGGKYSARDINQMTGTNDARRFISTLRRSGLNIQDRRQEDHSKLYWLPINDNRQLSFWERWEGVSYD